MKLKALMITTIACSAMTQFAMADIILTDSNDAKVTIANDGKCTYATENGFFRAYKGLKSIEIKDISKKNAKEGLLTQTFKKFLDGQYNQEHQTETDISIEGSDSSVKDIYGYIVNKIYNIKNLTFKNVLIEEFLPSEVDSIKFAQNATLTIDDAEPPTKPVSLATFGSPNIEMLNVNKATGRSTAYLRIGDYSSFKALTSMSVTGDIYWADDPADAEQDLLNKVYHGGALCTFIIPNCLRHLKIDLHTWEGESMGLYRGYTGVAIDEMNASSKLETTIGEFTSALFLINTKTPRTPIILRKPQINILGKLTVPTGPAGNMQCYRVRNDSPGFLWNADSFAAAKTSKDNSATLMYSISTDAITGDLVLSSNPNQPDRVAYIQQNIRKSIIEDANKMTGEQEAN